MRKSLRVRIRLRARAGSAPRNLVWLLQPLTKKVHGAAGGPDAPLAAQEERTFFIKLHWHDGTPSAETPPRRSPMEARAGAGFA